MSQRDLKPRTRALYQRLLERFLLPEFEHVALRDITPAVVRVWHAGLDPHRPTQRAHAYALLRSILATAVADERSWPRTPAGSAAAGPPPGPAASNRPPWNS